MITDIKNEGRLIQTTFGDYLRDRHQWDNPWLVSLSRRVP